MLARKHDWKRHRNKYNPLWYKGLHRTSQVEQPHAKDCQCKACKAYMLLIQQLNPERYADMTEPVGFFRKPALPDHVHQRRMRAYSIGSWRG